MYKQTSEMDESEIDDVPVSPALKVLRRSGYGSVPGLDDEELADPEELEEQVYKEQFEAILRLPVQPRKGGIRPNIDESGKVDFGAFATVDFDRICPDFDKALYKADKLALELRDQLIMVSIVSSRLPSSAQWQVLKLVRKGLLEVDEIVSEDMRALAVMQLRVERLIRDIQRLKEASWNRRKTKAGQWLEEE